MAASEQSNAWRAIRRLIVGLTLFVFFALFILWRIDNPRVERFRMALVDRFVPNMEWVLVPVTRFARITSDYQSYAQIYQRNQELRQELQRMKGWQEAALQLEQTNAQLRALNNVQLSPGLGFVTGEVITDSGSPFSQSGLLNVGEIDGLRDGQAAVDGLGLVGRISGLADHTARVVFLTDVSSQVPVIIRPTGQRAILHGDNTLTPKVLFIENPEDVLPGMRIVTSGDGGVFPPELLVGQIVRSRGGDIRALLAADFEGLEFVRILRSSPLDRINGAGTLVGGSIGPPLPPPEMPGGRNTPPEEDH
ncbi:MAG: rod shape-determining protein MreC [Rhodobacteraceae bacterium]|nr:rod shape-determining protein MreC [Paracoccaceae bacterium]